MFKLVHLSLLLFIIVNCVKFQQTFFKFTIASCSDQCNFRLGWHTHVNKIPYEI